MENLYEILLSGIGGAIVGGIITYITFFSKAKKEEKAKILGKVMEKRREALENIKNVIEELNVFERADIVHPDIINKPITYHAIFENYDSYENYSTKYDKMRKENDKYIDGILYYYICAGTIYLFMIRKVIYMGLGKNKNVVFTVGLIIEKEVDKWKRKTEYYINKAISKPKYKIKKRYGIIYDIKMKLIKRKIKKTTLYTQIIKPIKLEDENINNIFKKRDEKIS